MKKVFRKSFALSAVFVMLLGCKSRTLSSVEGYTDPRRAPLPLKLESAYNNLQDSSAALIQAGPTSARLEVAYAVHESNLGDVRREVDTVVADLGREAPESGLISAGSRDKTPKGRVNKTITNIHLLEYYARENDADQTEVDQDIPQLSGNSEASRQPRCGVSVAKRDELITDDPEWRAVAKRFGASRALIPHRIKVRSRYYVYAEPYSASTSKGTLKLEVPLYFQMLGRSNGGATQRLLGKNHTIKFFEVKLSTAQQPVGASCAFLIRKYRLAQVGSELWLDAGNRIDDVAILTSRDAVRALVRHYGFADDRQAYEQNPETLAYARFLPQSTQIMTEEGPRNRFDLESMMSTFVPGRLAKASFELDMQAVRARWNILKGRLDKNSRMRAFDLFVDPEKVQALFAREAPGNRNEAGKRSWNPSGYVDWLSEWRLRTLAVNLFYASDIKFVGAETPSPGQSSAAFIYWNKGELAEPTDDTFLQWWREYLRLAKTVDTWAGAVLKAQERYFRYTGTAEQAVLKTRAYDRSSWEIKAQTLSDRDANASGAKPAPETVQITLDNNLQIFLPRDLERKVSTFLNYPLRLNVIEFKFPMHHLASVERRAKSQSRVFERIRDVRDAFAGKDSYNPEGNQGKGKRPEGTLLWDFPNNPSLAISSFLNSPEGVACRVLASGLQRGARDCVITGQAVRQYLSAWSIRRSSGKQRVSAVFEEEQEPLSVLASDEAQNPPYEAKGGNPSASELESAITEEWVDHEG